MVTRRERTIIYVNFAPYENAGKILDYLFEKYQNVITFTFNFHRLKKKNDVSRLKEYKNKRIISEHRLYHIPTPPSLAFLLLPLRSVIIFFQLILHLYLLKKKYNKIDTYFTVNAFTAWTGNVAKRLGLLQQTIFWVWDYYPPVHKSKVVTFMRWLYWQLDKPATLGSNRVVFLNRRLEQLRKNIGLLPPNASYPVVGIGTKPIERIKTKYPSPLRVSFLGVLKKSQGLDLLFDTSKYLSKKITVDIVGAGPDEDHFLTRAKNSNINAIFHGYIREETKVDLIISKTHIGIATYIPEDGNVSYYSDPSKIKRYISQGVPVITTDVFDFANEIQKAKAGVVIPYSPKHLLKAIQKITTNYKAYQERALALAKAYEYRKIYRKLFEE